MEDLRRPRTNRPTIVLAECVPRMARDPIEVLEETGAGEGIRTLDPDLGKVVLYP